MMDQDKVTMLLAVLLAISALKVDPDSDPLGTIANIQAMAARVVERVKKSPPMTDESAVEIRRNDDGSVDEIVAKGCDVHIEQMDAPHWFMQIGREVFSIWEVKKGRSWVTEIAHVETRAP